MSEDAKRHPFIDDLGEDVVLVSSVLRQAIQGRDAVLKVVKAGASRYAAQRPRFLGTVGERSYFEYDVDLVGGGDAVGLVSILRDADGRVTYLHVGFSPLGAVLSIAQGIRDQLAAELGAEPFL